MTVVDASVLIDVVLQRGAGPSMQPRLLRAGVSLHVPHVADLEVAQVLRRYQRTREVDPGRGSEALRDLAGLPLVRWPHQPFLARIWELRGSLTAYDAAYVSLAEALGMRVIYFDIRTRLPLGNAQQTEKLDTLLKGADIVTLHVPEDETTINMLGRTQLKLMKKDACLLNASRGKVVDIDALADLMKKGHLRGAAVDVFPREPGSATEPFNSPLIGIQNIILTPHIGGSTQEAQKNIGSEVAMKLVGFSDLGNTEGAVNFPNVNLRPNDNATRLLHIHENRPGMLRAINELIARRGINVTGQYLETKNEIGYVVLDVEPFGSGKVTKALRAELEKIEGTIRTRVLY